MADTAYVATLPNCDFCRINDTVNRPAAYDAKTVHGPWASMCEEHYNLFAATKELGTGKGQRYVVGERPERDRSAEARAALAANDFEAFEDAVGDGDPADYL